MVNCSNCGKFLPHNPNFCEDCGYKLQKNSHQDPVLSKNEDSCDVRFKNFIIEYYKDESSDNIVLSVMNSISEKSNVFDYDGTMRSAREGYKPIKEHLEELDSFKNLSPKWKKIHHEYNKAILEILKMINCVLASNNITSQQKIDEATVHIENFNNYFNVFQELFIKETENEEQETQYDNKNEASTIKPIEGSKLEYELNPNEMLQKLTANCPFCGETFNFVVDFNNQLGIVNELCKKCGETITLDMTNATPWKCDTCGEQFHTKEEAEEHEKTCKISN